MAKLKPKVFTARWYHHLIARFNWALILGAALILIFFSYQYIFKVRREMEKSGGSLDLSYYEKNLEKEKEYLKNLKTLKEETDKISEKELEKLNMVIGSSPNLPDVLNQIHQLIKEQDLRIQSFSINSEKGTTTISLGLTNSSYEMMKRFLKAVENNLPIMDITDLSFPEDQASFNLTLKTYYQE